MSISLGFDLTIEQSQKLVMTPELIQAIKILQFNTQELENYVEEQVLSNPVLEKENENIDKKADSETDPQWEESPEKPADGDNDIDWREIIRQKQYDDISYGSDNYRADPEEDRSYEGYVASEETLVDHLIIQLPLVTQDDKLLEVGEYIIEALNDNGYLTIPLEEIAADNNTDIETIEEALRLIQSLDPVGVGARNIQECLIIQLQQSGIYTETYGTLINQYLEDLGTNRIGSIAKALGISKIEVQSMVDTIKSLEPKPGRMYISSASTRYITPDVFVEEIEGKYVVVTNEGSVPHLAISSYYKNLLQQAESDKELSGYLSDRINSALWLIKSINQRKETIYNVVSEVVDYQEDFFSKGSKYMKPLTLKVIAEKLGIHESTVSRSINGKYVQSPRGLFEIKHFFSSGVSSTGGGDEISSNSVKEFIQEMVNEEDATKPLSDQDMVVMLKDKGINISRRTVAKYRDELNIPSSSKRRRY